MRRRGEQFKYRATFGAPGRNRVGGPASAREAGRRSGSVVRRAPPGAGGGTRGLGDRPRGGRTPPALAQTAPPALL